MASRLVIASDHGGFALKDILVRHLKSKSMDIDDLGTTSEQSVDYPDYAHALAEHILAGKSDLGILICGTGLGVSISANKHEGIRAALCTDPYMARMAREHNDANVLCLGGRVVGCGLALEIVESFLSSDFEGGRHARRVAKMEIR